MKKDFSKSEFLHIPLDNILTPPQPAPPQPKREPRKETHSKAKPTRAGSKYVAAYDPDTEPRTRRVQLLMRPGLHDDLKALADRRKQSLNNLIENILAEYIEQVEK